MSERNADMDVDRVIETTRAWIERAVIGLDLCPFAKSVYVRDQVRVVVSLARDTAALLDDLRRELNSLADVAPDTVETTLIVHPHVLDDFLEYNDFLDTADAALRGLDLEGTIQIASFHPQYRFAGSAPDDVENNTNRSPFPMLHLLREASLARAVASVPDPDAIYLKNMDTMRRLGAPGWAALGVSAPARPPR